MKTRAIDAGQYPGDTFKLVEVLNNVGQWVHVLGVYIEKHRGRNYWANDQNCECFDTLKQAKEYAVKFYNTNIA